MARRHATIWRWRGGNPRIQRAAYELYGDRMVLFCASIVLKMPHHGAGFALFVVIQNDLFNRSRLATVIVCVDVGPGSRTVHKVA